MKKKILFGSILCLLIMSGQTSFAQSSFIVAGEAGVLRNEFGNGVKKDVPVFGGTIAATLGGNTSKNSGVAFQVYGELKTDAKGENTDLIAGGDLAIRYKNFSFGPGANLGLVSRPEVEDPTCRNLPADPAGTRSSCSFNGGGGGRSGKRVIGDLQVFGVGGFAKYSFGPQGRAFVQGRFIYYDKSLGSRIIGINELAELASVSVPFQIQEYTDIPAFKNGRDVRVSAGYVFKGNVFVRGQYTDRKFDFVREQGNITGVFDQKGRTITAGVGFIF